MTTNLASDLVGKTLGSWRVVSKIQKPGGSGGGFSSGYIVQKDGRKAFLKALNVQYAFNSTGGQGATMMDRLKDLTDNFIHERDLLNFCSEKNMDRIVVALDSGEYAEPALSPFPVPFLIFELCENGDVRNNPKLSSHGLSWRLRIFHGACLGVSQLHKHNIAHQDVKPENILVFGADQTKLADLGRSTRKMPGARFGNPEDCGYNARLPFELFYGHSDPDWDIRRKATDIFMLGGVLVFLISHLNIVGLVFSKMPISFHFTKWSLGYTAALPAIQKAFNETVDEIVLTVRDDMKGDIRELIVWLCNPDPGRRGHPRTVDQLTGKYSLERIISVTDRLSKKALYN